MIKKGRLIILMILVTALLTGCGSSNLAGEMKSMDSSQYYPAANGVKSGGSYVDAERAPEQSSAQKQAKKDGKSENSSDSNDAEQVESTRKLIYRVQMETETLEFDQFISFLDTKTLFYGGYVESSSISGTSYSYEERNRYANVILRVPSKHLDSFINEIGELANITSNSRSTEDVTLSYIETESRLASLEIQRDKLLEWMEKAETVEDMIALESRLSEVRYELEYYGSILRNYDNLVEYSTISINIQEVQRITPPVEEGIGSRMWSGLKENLIDIKDGSIDFSVWFVSSLPYLILWAIVIVIIIFVVRALYRKEKRRLAQYNQQVIEKKNSLNQSTIPQENQATNGIEQNK